MSDSFSLSSSPRTDVAEIRRTVPTANFPGIYKLTVPIDLYWRRFYLVATSESNGNFLYTGKVNFYRNSELILSDSFVFGDYGRALGSKNRFWYGIFGTVPTLNPNGIYVQTDWTFAIPPYVASPWNIALETTSVEVVIDSATTPDINSFIFMRIESQNVWN